MKKKIRKWLYLKLAHLAVLAHPADHVMMIVEECDKQAVDELAAKHAKGL